MELCRSGRIVERDLSVAIAVASRRRFSLTRKDGIKWPNSCTERFFYEFQNIVFSKEQKQKLFSKVGEAFWTLSHDSIVELIRAKSENNEKAAPPTARTLGSTLPRSLRGKPQ